MSEGFYFPLNLIKIDYLTENAAPVLHQFLFLHQKFENMAKTTLKLFPNQLKACKKTGKIPIYARIYHHGKKADKRLIQSITPDELTHWNEVVQRINISGHKVNKILNKVADSFDDFITTNSFELSTFSADYIRDIIFNHSKKTETTAVGYIKDYLDNYIINSRDLTEGTKKNYKTAYNHCKRFCEINNLLTLPISKFDVLIANKFHQYLLNEYEIDCKRAMLKVTATGRIKQLRTIFNKAIDENIIIKNPFKSIKNTNFSKPRIRLNIAQIKTIFKIDLTDMPVLEIYRDLFIFSVVTGLSYSDVMSLSKDKVFINKLDLFLSILRTKTLQVTEMYFPKIALEIFKKYRDNKECKIKGTLLPKRSNQKINIHLKIIALKCEITTNVTFHLARYSFRSVLKEAGIVETLERKTLMGHSTRNDIDAVYHNVTAEHLLEAKRKIDNFIDNQILND